MGGLLLATLQQGLRLNGVDPVYFSIVTGLCIVLGVVFDRGVQRLVLNRLLGRSPTEPPPVAPSEPSGPATVPTTVGSRT